MSRVGIVTDSLSSLPQGLAREYGIEVAAVNMSINGKPYLDGATIDSGEFWEMFASGEVKQFSTGAVSPGEFIRIFREMGRKTDGIVCIVISRLLSAAYQAAVTARENVQSDFPGLTIEIIDSKSVGGVEGFAAIEAARAAREGKVLTEVSRAAQDVISNAKIFYALDTLKYIIKSGRAPESYKSDEEMQVKHIMGFTNGSGVLEDIARAATRSKAMERMVDMVEEFGDTSKPLHLIAYYTDSKEAGKELLKKTESRYKCAESYLAPFSPAMAAYTGPLVGVCFFR